MGCEIGLTIDNNYGHSLAYNYGHTKRFISLSVNLFIDLPFMSLLAQRVEINLQKRTVKISVTYMCV